MTPTTLELGIGKNRAKKRSKVVAVSAFRIGSEAATGELTTTDLSLSFLGKIYCQSLVAVASLGRTRGPIADRLHAGRPEPQSARRGSRLIIVSCTRQQLQYVDAISGGSGPI